MKSKSIRNDFITQKSFEHVIKTINGESFDYKDTKADAFVIMCDKEQRQHCPKFEVI